MTSLRNTLLSILLILFSSDFSVQASAGVAGKTFEDCIIKFGQLILVENEIPENVCHVANTLNDVVRSSLQNYVNRVSSFDKFARGECFRRWKDDWEEVFAVERAPEFKRFASETVTDPRSRFSDRYYKLFRRAEFERNMTLLIQKRKYPSKAPADDCYSMWMSLIGARADNVGFLLQNGFVDDLQQGKMPPSVYPQFWLIVQHADLHVDFQKEVLQILETSGAENQFPERLITSLRDRVAHNMEYLEE